MAAWKGRFRAFRSCTEISIKQRDKAQVYFGGFLYTRAPGIIQIRSSVGAAEPAFLLKPYPVMDTLSSFEALLVAYMETLNIPGEHLSLLAKDLTHQLVMASTKLFGGDPKHSYVIFFDIKIKGEDNKFTPDDRYLENLTGEDAKEIVGRSREIYVLRRSSRMKEVKECAFDRRNDSGVEDCPICMQEMCLDEEYVTTPCKHVFHTGCLGKWLVSSYKPRYVHNKYKKISFPSCPNCRQCLEA